MGIIQTFPSRFSVSPVMRRLGLDPEALPGTREVLDTIFNLHIEPKRHTMAQTDFAQGVERGINYWEVMLGAATDFREPYFNASAPLPDPICACIIGGADLVVDATIRPWKTDAAQQACRIYSRAMTLANPEAFEHAPIEEQFVAQMAIYADLCEEHAKMSADPSPYKGLPLGKVEGVGMAARLGIGASPLANAIILGEHKVAALWRSLNTARGPRATIA